MEPTSVRARESRPDPAMPLVERAQLVLRDPRAAAQLRPEDWPETKQIAAAYGAAIGSPRTLSELKRDSGLRAIVELIAAGYAVDDITWLASSVPREAWWRSGNRIRGLGSLSIEVASRALAERGAPPRPTVAKARGAEESDEARRIHRNTLLENAAAGWYGPERPFNRRGSARSSTSSSSSKLTESSVALKSRQPRRDRDRRFRDAMAPRWRGSLRRESASPAQGASARSSAAIRRPYWRQSRVIEIVE